MIIARLRLWQLTPYGLRLAVPVITISNSAGAPNSASIRVAVLDLSLETDRSISVGIAVDERGPGLYDISRWRQPFIIPHERLRSFFGVGKVKKAKEITLIWKQSITESRFEETHNNTLDLSSASIPSLSKSVSTV